MFTPFRMVLVFAGLAFFLTTPISAQVKTPEMKKLLKERSELLDEALEIATAQFLRGILSIADVSSLQKEALKAGLDLHDDPKERLNLLRRSVEFTQKCAAIADQEFKVGKLSKIDLLRARAAILEARVELLLEEEKQKPAKAGK